MCYTSQLLFRRSPVDIQLAYLKENNEASKVPKHFSMDKFVNKFVKKKCYRFKTFNLFFNIIKTTNLGDCCLQFETKRGSSFNT